MAVVIVRIVGALMAGGMLLAIAWGFVDASFGDDGAQLLALTWGRVTLIDLYLAFLFAWIWIAWRERTWPRRLVWLLLVVTTGSLAIGLYLLLASRGARTVDQVVLPRAQWERP